MRLSVLALAVLAASAAAAQEINRASFTDSGEAERPENCRQWVFVGAPLTPNALNDGAAAFPEFHNVYVEPSAYAEYARTGAWPEGTQIAKELTLVLDGSDEIGATVQASGRGYFQGAFAGLELAVKDSERFPDQPGGWAYFSFGHHEPPYAETSAAFPAESCNACHEANAADDFVFTQFYPVLQAARPAE